MSQALTSYIDELRRDGKRPGTLRTYESAIRLFVNRPGMEVRRITVEWLKRRVAEMDRSVDYRASKLRATKTWLRWCAERGWLPEMNTSKVEVKGARKCGEDSKTQLSADEAARFVDVVLRERAEVAVAVLAPLLMGLSGQEIWDRRVRDIDRGGTVWVVRRGKTTNRIRSVEIPAVLQPLVAELTEGKRGSDWLFRGKGGGSRKQTWCQQHTARLCDEADVPRCCPHGLRGTHASLAVQAGATSQVVADALGHGGDGVTRRHYVQRGAQEQATQRQVLRVVAGGKR